jgi:predicted TIM-barrel fold metal-dependent hydrolase
MEGTVNEEINATVDEKNRWRLETPGHHGWERTARPDDPNKYLMISADCHVNEPSKLWWDRIDRKFRDRLPHVEVDEKGHKWMVVEGYQRSRMRTRNIQDAPKGGEDRLRGNAGRDPLDRIRDHARDGIDAEIVFPNKGLAVFATQDAEFGAAQCRVWNDWAWEVYGPYNDFMSPMAAIFTADVGLALAEIKRVAKIGFRGLTLPCKPVWGAHDARHPNYNLPIFDPMWALIQETGLPITFHVSTGRDPRAARKDGGAVINYVSHSLSPTIEPVANLCASGVLERFPQIRFAAIECGIGWVPWALNAMDEAYRKHHLWVDPKLKKLPSDYFRSNGAASFQEDPAGLDLAVKWNLVDNFMWANDYPHAEGTWPHSAEAIEREMGGLTGEQRAKILGLNAARIFKFDIEKLLARRQTTTRAAAN